MRVFLSVYILVLGIGIQANAAAQQLRCTQANGTVTATLDFAQVPVYRHCFLSGRLFNPTKTCVETTDSIYPESVETGELATVATQLTLTSPNQTTIFQVHDLGAGPTHHTYAMFQGHVRYGHLKIAKQKRDQTISGHIKLRSDGLAIDTLLSCQ